MKDRMEAMREKEIREAASNFLARQGDGHLQRLANEAHVSPQTVRRLCKGANLEPDSWQKLERGLIAVGALRLDTNDQPKTLSESDDLWNIVADGLVTLSKTLRLPGSRHSDSWKAERFGSAMADLESVVESVFSSDKDNG